PRCSLRATLFPYTPLFRSFSPSLPLGPNLAASKAGLADTPEAIGEPGYEALYDRRRFERHQEGRKAHSRKPGNDGRRGGRRRGRDRKSTRLNSSHVKISYA